MRSIARDAGVDHSLVNYYFEGKQGLFAQVLAIAMTPGEVLGRVFDAAPDQLPERLVATLIGVWDQGEFREPLLAALRASGEDPALRGAVAAYIGAEVHGRLREQIGGADASAHATAVMALLGGVVFTRYVVGVEPVASMTREQLVRLLAPMIRPHLRGLPR